MVSFMSSISTSDTFPQFLHLREYRSLPLSEMIRIGSGFPHCGHAIFVYLSFSVIICGKCKKESATKYKLCCTLVALLVIIEYDGMRQCLVVVKMHESFSYAYPLEPSVDCIDDYKPTLTPIIASYIYRPTLHVCGVPYTSDLYVLDWITIRGCQNKWYSGKSSCEIKHIHKVLLHILQGASKSRELAFGKILTPYHRRYSYACSCCSLSSCGISACRH